MWTDGGINGGTAVGLVNKLYKMKHYGKNLRDCAKKTGQAYAATFRERPFRVRNRNAYQRGWANPAQTSLQPRASIATKQAIRLPPHARN